MDTLGRTATCGLQGLARGLTAPGVASTPSSHRRALLMMPPMSQPIPAHEFTAEPDTSYLAFCPEHGGWHVAEWWVADGRGRWVLAYDVSVELFVSHIMPVPEDAMDEISHVRWAVLRQMVPMGRC